MDPILRFITHRPWIVLALLAALTFGALAGVVDPASGEIRLRFDPSTNRLFPQDDPEREFYEFVRRLFGSDETMLVALSSDDVFTPENLERVKAMTERIEALPEVHHVISLTTAVNLTGGTASFNAGAVLAIGEVNIDNSIVTSTGMAAGVGRPSPFQRGSK